MSRFRSSKRKEVPELNTASLPDLVFSLLFFFMIVTSMRTVPVMTQFDLPAAETLQKLEEKSLLLYVMVGKNTDKIQLNSEFIGLDEMPDRLQAIKKDLPASDREQLTAVLKIDKDTPMRVVSEIKRNLQEARVLTLHYSAEPISRKT
ncbi:MAG: biopolymer transporter ExbD [Candidatus Symbiothrix sp.]|jgi:biopolymer transport protein ExbD|nr:biopolymer transporter ExbD [Candidatus Symbiothrix sp.]